MNNTENHQENNLQEETTIIENNINVENDNLENEIKEEENLNTIEIDIESKYKEELSIEKEKFLRLFAEFENYKKRTLKERIDLIKTANQEVLLAMLPVLDDFDRAMEQISKSEDENLKLGVNLIQEKFKNTLISKGLEQVILQAGDDFNADFAEAITQIPAPSEELKGKIVDVVEKGYKLGDKIIRFPKVVLGN
ncbi:MAG: nucleotide exchange factor GrpE [Flavobacterium sp.]